MANGASGKRLGGLYYGFAAAGLVAAIAVGGVSAADASDQPGDAAAPFVMASGYGADRAAPEASAPDAEQDEAVDTCLAAAAERYEGDVSLAQVNRAWEGTEGWIVDLSLDVARAGKRSRRRDALCRQSEHGLQVARY